MKRKISFLTLIMCGILMLSFGISASVQAEEYKDIKNHFAEEAIQRWSQNGVIKGYNSAFRPDDSITRGEMAVILNRILGYDKSYNNRNRFADVPSKFYKEDLLSLNEQGIIKGSDNKLRPEDKITRQEAAVILVRAFQIRGQSTSLNFSDRTKLADWAKEAVSVLTNEKYMNGYQGKINPLGSLTRGELVKLLDNMIGAYITESGQYSDKELTESVSNNKLIIIRKGDVKLKDIRDAKKIIVSASDEVESVFFQNAKVKEVDFLKGKNEVIVLLENTEVKNLNRTEKQKVYADEKSKVSGNKSADEPLEKGIAAIKEKNSKLPYPLENEVVTTPPASDNTPNTDNTPSAPSVPVPTDQVNHTTELTVFLNNLSSDGKVYFSATEEISLPSSALIGKKATGENTGNLITVTWKTEKQEKFDAKEAGEYIFTVETAEAVVINDKNYGKVRFELTVVIR